MQTSIIRKEIKTERQMRHTYDLAYKTGKGLQVQQVQVFKQSGQVLLSLSVLCSYLPHSRLL